MSGGIVRKLESQAMYPSDLPFGTLYSSARLTLCLATTTFSLDESWSDILHLLISFVNSRLRGGCQSDIQSKLPNERVEETESAKENGFDTDTQLFV
jgi:hypothetical protein